MPDTTTVAGTTSAFDRFMQLLGLGAQTYIASRSIEAGYAGQGITVPQISSILGPTTRPPIDVAKTAMIIGGVLLGGIVIFRLMK